MNPLILRRLIGGGKLYLGNVATRLTMPPILSPNSLTQGSARTYHFSRDAITSLKLIFANWTGLEVPTGAPILIKASVEYPAGVFTQVNFSGSSEGTILSGQMLTSDLVDISIPNGAKFYVRSFQTSTAGVIYDTRADTANGDAFEFAGAGLIDKTMGGTVGNQAGFRGNGPVAIIAMTEKPTVGLIGDSRQYGFSDSYTGVSGDVGEAGRSIGPYYGYINAGVSGANTYDYLNGQNSQRDILLGYCSHIVSNLGVNDCYAQLPQNEIYARLSAIRSHYGKPFFQTTIPPKTATTDGWATLNNQSSAIGDANRLGLNTLIRANSNGFSGVFDIEPIVSTLNSSGIMAWNPGNTIDGVHETNSANIAILASGVIDPSAFFR